MGETKCGAISVTYTVVGQDLNTGPSLTVMASGLQLQRESPVLPAFGIECEPLPSPAQALKQYSKAVAPLSSSEAQLIHLHWPGSPHIYSIPAVSVYHQAQGHSGSYSDSTNSWGTLKAQASRLEGALKPLAWRGPVPRRPVMGIIGHYQLQCCPH